MTNHVTYLTNFRFAAKFRGTYLGRKAIFGCILIVSVELIMQLPITKLKFI